MNNNDNHFMTETLKLARKGLGKTYPNPLVGAIIVKDGRIIGKGYHQKAGGPHAEIKAINSARESLKGSTLYVNLEPHGYIGKTPPCTDAIIASGIQKVVCSTLDPNPRVQGQGIKQLQEAGIEVKVGALAEQAQLLNEQFFTFHQKNRPFIAVKYAASLDGKLATRTGDSQWITDESARAYGRNLRSRYQAILVGINTVIADDPHLGSRQVSKTDPLRIILDSKLRIPLNSQVLRDHNVLITTTSSAPAPKIRQLRNKGFTVVAFDDKRIPLKKLMKVLSEMSIISVMVEGGGEIIGNFIDNKLIDRVYGFYAPILIGGKEAVSIQGTGVSKVTEAFSINQPHIRHFGNNFLIEGRV